MKRELVLVLLIALASCAGSSNKYDGLPHKKISKAEMGADWCLTVDEGVIYCDKDLLFLFDTPDGKTYAVNGTAKTHTDFPDLETIMIPGHMENCVIMQNLCR